MEILYPMECYIQATFTFKDFVQNARVNNNNKNNNINSCCDFKTIKRESYRCGGKVATVSIEKPVVAQIVLRPWEASFLWSELVFFMLKAFVALNYIATTTHIRMRAAKQWHFK
ncbi:hypothetical protein GQX74_013010 [Glossina fuscipes]|nr:hypothetical protein GQX74_013010 [Glossina fuscipes]